MKDRAPETLTVEDLKAGHEAYVKNEPLDAMYEAATSLLEMSGEEPSKMANGLGVLLLTWNSGLYRYGPLDFKSLKECVERNLEKIQGFKKRNITTFAETDKQSIQELFDNFLEATRKLEWKKSPEKLSPVSVAKALHMLAPGFFPLWDDEIARKYGCYWYAQSREKGASKYWKFMQRIAKFVDDFQKQSQEIIRISERPILKLIDEYNYCRFTKAKQRWLIVDE